MEIGKTDEANTIALANSEKYVLERNKRVRFVGPMSAVADVVN